MQFAAPLRTVLGAMRCFALIDRSLSIPGSMWKVPYVFAALLEGKRMNVNQIVRVVAKESNAELLLRHQTVRSMLNTAGKKGLVISEKSETATRRRPVTYFRLSEGGEILAKGMVVAFRSMQEQLKEKYGKAGSKT